MKITGKLATLLLFGLLSGCSSNNNQEPERWLDAARQHYNQKEYTLATQAIDSLKTLYPKAFDQIKASLVLLDSVRKGENNQIIETCDSLISSFEPKIEQTKRMFVYQKNKEYQETGNYIPRESASDIIQGTLLRSGVNDAGQLYIESVFVGGQRHNKMRISLKDGSFVETLPVTDDGLNYRFSNMGKSYEIIRFSGTAENETGKFIFSNMDKPLTVTLEGNGKYSYNLSQATKSAISKSYQLSVMMIQLDSLKTEKEKAQYRNYYLDNEKGKDLDVNENL